MKIHVELNPISKKEEEENKGNQYLNINLKTVIIDYNL